MLKKQVKVWIKRLSQLICWIDGRQLWWIGLIMLGIVMVPHVRLGEGSVFTVHGIFFPEGKFWMRKQWGLRPWDILRQRIPTGASGCMLCEWMDFYNFKTRR